MRIDADKTHETKTVAEVSKGITDNYIAGNRYYGYCLNYDSVRYLNVLNMICKNGDRFPVQMNSGSLINMSMLDIPNLDLDYLIRSEKIKLFVHLPFIIPPWHDPKTINYAYDYFNRISGIYEGYGDKVSFILHSGYPIFNVPSFRQCSTQEEYDAKYREIFEREKGYYIQNISNWAEMIDGNLLLENLAGAGKHRYKFASIQVLVNMLNKINKPNLKICYDTEHAWADGETFGSICKMLGPVPEKYVGLIHFNSAPCNAGFGKHIDLHSYTKIENSFGRIFTLSGNAKELINLQEFLLYFKKVPAIFERLLMSVEIADAGYIYTKAKEWSIHC